MTGMAPMGLLFRDGDGANGLGLSDRGDGANRLVLLQGRLVFCRGGSSDCYFQYANGLNTP